MLIEMYGESWIAGLLTSDDVMLYMAGFETVRGILTVLAAQSWHELYGIY